jgi:hypothetical protein
VTERALGGLVVLNGFFLVAGTGVLWGIRGWRAWTELVRLAGLAYLLGVGSLMVLMTFELTVGIPTTEVTILLDGAFLVVAGIAFRGYRGGTWPRLVPEGWRFPRLSVFVALFLAGIAVYLEGMFRSERLAGVVNEFDSWAFWMPKAEWIYFFGHLDRHVLALLPGSAYPIGLSSIQAAAFHAIGSADTVTLHSQYWFFGAGFVAAAAGVLVERVRPTIVAPVLLAVLVAPSLVAREMITYADLPLGYLVATGALLVALWVEERHGWLLAAATLLLAAAMSTKREGMLFAAAVLGAALVASARDGRRSWRPLLLAGGAALVLTLPWRIWFTAEGIPSDRPETGYLGSFRHLDRVWPSLRLVLRTLFDNDLWPFVAGLSVAAIVLAALAGASRLAVYGGTILVAAVAACAWAIWSNTSLSFSEDDSLNPIIRLTGTTILALAVLTPLLLQAAWTGSGQREARPRRGSPGPEALVWRSLGAWSIVLLGVLSHPGSMLLGYSRSGLPGGAPTFPSHADCVAHAPRDSGGRLVGYADSYPEAFELRRRAVNSGLRNVEVRRDGCGRVRVFEGGS